MAAVTGLTDSLLAQHDIGLLNLMSGLGLPGAENLNIEACIERLDAWASGIRAYTEHCWPEFQRKPQNHDHSPGAFCIMAMVTFLQRAAGVQYNLAFSEGEYNATDSRNLFLHGILLGHGGTCVSLPVLHLAIGRRLGYPLKLAQAKEHYFARWEEPGGERFNIECTSRGFLGPLDDEHFRHYPKPLSDEELRSGAYLQSLRPREELAMFLCERAKCAVDNLWLSEAIQACFLADQLARDHPEVRGTSLVVTVMYRVLEQARREAGLPGYEGLDLRRIHVPDGHNAKERAAVPLVRNGLYRIARIREKNRNPVGAQVHDLLYRSADDDIGEIFPVDDF
jgi:hypothetical protein